MHYVDKLRVAIQEKGFTQAEMADKLGTAQSTLAKWISKNPEHFREMPFDMLIKSAEILGVSSDYLLGVETTKPVKNIPIIGTASCGATDINYLQEEGKTALYRGDMWHKELYCVIACGDSMSPEIEDGDEVICDPRATVQHGDIVHYRILGESAIKVLVEDKEAHIIQLVPYNQTDTFKTRTIRLDDDELLELKMSKVVAINKLKFNNRTARLKLIGRV